MWSLWCSATRQAGAAVAAGLAALVQRQVKGALAEPARASQDEAAGVVWARTWGPGGGVTILPGLVHALMLVAGVIAVVRSR